MFGWKLIRESELALREFMAEERVNAAKSYAAKCEALLDHERARIDSERERADRIADSLFQSQGLPATSATVRDEQKHEDLIRSGKQADYQKELLAIYGETIEDMNEDAGDPIEAIENAV